MRWLSTCLCTCLCLAHTSILTGVSHWSPQLSEAQPITPSTSLGSYLSELKIPFEQHTVTTDDNYILSIHRLPNPGKRVVLLQHGILASTWCWLANEPDRALGVILYRAGYDVFFGNNRGNSFGRNHTHLPVNSKEFWNFTFTEFGTRDLPCIIDTALALSGAESLSLVAWSQGNTQTLVAGSNRKTIGRLRGKINMWIALSPVSYLSHSTSALLTLASRLKLGALLEKYFPYGFLDGSAGLSSLELLLCKITFGEVCKLGVDAICGVSSCDDKSALDRLVAHFPAGTSVKDITHYEQFINHPFFGYYDYGEGGNILEYGQKTPPAYNVSLWSEMGAPVYFFLGGKDDLVSGDDLAHLQSKLPENLVAGIKYYENFSHVTWMVGDSKSSSLWTNDVLVALSKV